MDGSLARKLSRVFGDGGLILLSVLIIIGVPVGIVVGIVYGALWCLRRFGVI